MATLADPSWVEYWIELGDVHILDPRPASQYAQGHLPDAVSLPLEKILGARRVFAARPSIGSGIWGGRA